MTTLKEAAQSYEAPRTKNVAELDKVPTEVNVEERTYTNKDGEDFTVNIVVVNGEEYRVPNSVLNALKDHLEANPKLAWFRVKKSGEGLKTNYTVIPLQG